MLEQIKTLLLQDKTLQGKIKQAANTAEAAEAIIAAGLEKGYRLVAENVSAAFHDVQLSMAPRAHELSEEDLLAVAGGRMRRGGAATSTCTGSVTCASFCTVDTKSMQSC